MKKFLAFLVFGGAAVLAARAENLLTNESFEVMSSTDPADWSGMTWEAYQARHTDWAARHGTNGVYFESWQTSYTEGEFWQDVTVSSTGTYTFTIWARRESGVTLTSLKVVLCWRNSGGGQVQADTEQIWTHLPNDGEWHMLYVTGSCGSPSLDHVRVKVYAKWGSPGGGGTTIMFDDAQLYSGGYTGTVNVWNPSFEEPRVYGNSDWRKSQWSMDPEGVGGGFEDWAWRSGQYGLALWGWASDQPSYDITFRQNVYPLSTHDTFRIWMKREADFLLTNCELRIEWYDTSMVNQVSVPCVTNLDVVNDATWHEYHVSGVCTGTGLYEARVKIRAQFLYNPDTNNTARAMMIDDARFMSGDYQPYTGGIDIAWSYHGGGTNDPSYEAVPGLGGVHFLDVDYQQTTTVFRVMARHPDFAVRAGETGTVMLRTWYWNPETASGVETFLDADEVTSVVIDAASPFHGLPTSGSETVDVYVFHWQQPLSTNGTPLTDDITVYYSPYLQVWYGETRTDPDLYLVERDGEQTNNFTVDPQLLSSNYYGKDYSYRNARPSPLAAFTNGGFESPGTTNTTLDDTGWRTMGGAGRERWAPHSGSWHGYLAGWDTSTTEKDIYQDVAVTGGTYTFEMWIAVEEGFNPSVFDLRLEWYADDMGTLLASDSTNLLAMPHDNTYRRVYVESTCTATNVGFLRARLYTIHGAPTTNSCAVKFDDARLMAGTFVDPLVTDWAYHNAGPTPATNELVPGTNNFGTFLQVDYATTTTTFYVLANWSSVARRGDESGNVGLRTSWQDPISGNWTESWASMSWQANVVLADTNRFHGSPSSGLVTVDVWSVDWHQPCDTNGVPYTNAITVYYSPYIESYYNGELTGRKFLLRQNGTPNNYNSYPQQLGEDYYGNDYSYVNQYQAAPSGDSDGDGMPDWWESQYFGGATNADAHTDSDGDGAENLEEYIADTDPTDAASFFDNVVTNISGAGVMSLTVGPPTTNSRVYDVLWCTDLVEGTWSEFGFDQPGNADGSALQLTVTNDLGLKFYRTSVKVP